MKFMKLGSKPDTFQTDGNNVRIMPHQFRSDDSYMIDETLLLHFMT